MITAKDHASVQINIGHVDQNGVYTGEFTPLALCGYVRSRGYADDAVNRFATDRKFLKSVL